MNCTTKSETLYRLVKIKGDRNAKQAISKKQFLKSSK